MSAGAAPDSWVQRTLSIDVPPADLLRAWCDPDVQRRVLADRATLVAGDGRCMEWSVRAPGDRHLKVELRQVEWTEGRRVRYLGQGEHRLRIETDLAVQPAPADFGTEARLRVGYSLPGGAIAETLVEWLGSAPELLVSTVLRRFKALLEAGEIPTLDRNPSARKDD